MGMGGGSAKPSFTFNDKDALALNQQNTKQLQQYQLQRQKAVAGQNAKMAQHYEGVNMLAQDNLLRNMSMYTNALGGYQNSLNQNTADAQSLMNEQQQYYNSVLTGQQQYQNQFAGLMGQYNQQAAADNAAYQQQYLNQLGQYNQDNTAQQQQFMSNYLNQMNGYNQQNIDAQQRYQEAYQNQRRTFQGMKQQTAANQTQIDQQNSQQGLMALLQQWQNNPTFQAMQHAVNGSVQAQMNQGNPNVIFPNNKMTIRR
jgi:hypothetical protein